MQAEHSEAEVRAEPPTDVRVRGAARRLVPAVGNGNVGLDVDPRRRHVDAEAGTSEEVGHFGKCRGPGGDSARGARAELDVQRDGNEAPTDDPELCDAGD